MKDQHTKNQWYWILLIVLSLFVILSQLYLEVGLIMRLYVVPYLKASGELKYYESLGLFAPALYLFQGGIKILEWLGPFLKFIEEALLVFNSLLLIVTLVATRFIFKHKIWAAMYIIVLSIASLIVWLDI